MFALPVRLILAAAATGVLASGVQAQDTADWRGPDRFLPPALGAEMPDRAAECLALAISYEAGLEPVAGQEAVAQVILNRVRHPSYPDTACGVVWQGSTRRTGCQFTFTCDGSLRRARSAAALASARAVAARVLAGDSADHVRGATHYHADYVAPYWAPSLTRVRQIATHIFYRTPGAVVRGPGQPVFVTLAAITPSASAPAPAPASDTPAIAVTEPGVFAPWGLTVGQIRR